MADPWDADHNTRQVVDIRLKFWQVSPSLCVAKERWGKTLLETDFPLELLRSRRTRTGTSLLQQTVRQRGLPLQLTDGMPRVEHSSAENFTPVQHLFSLQRVRKRQLLCAGSPALRELTYWYQVLHQNTNQRARTGNGNARCYHLFKFEQHCLVWHRARSSALCAKRYAGNIFNSHLMSCLQR